MIPFREARGRVLLLIGSSPMCSTCRQTWRYQASVNTVMSKVEGTVDLVEDFVGGEWSSRPPHPRTVRGLCTADLADTGLLNYRSWTIAFFDAIKLRFIKSSKICMCWRKTDTQRKRKRRSKKKGREQRCIPLGAPFPDLTSPSETLGAATGTRRKARLRRTHDGFSSRHYINTNILLRR